MTKSLKLLIFVPLPLYGLSGNSKMKYAFRVPGGGVLLRKIANMLWDWRLLTKEELKVTRRADARVQGEDSPTSGILGLSGSARESL
jgi:hypothetical protein